MTTSISAASGRGCQRARKQENTATSALRRHRIHLGMSVFAAARGMAAPGTARQERRKKASIGDRPAPRKQHRDDTAGAKRCYLGELIPQRIARDAIER